MSKSSIGLTGVAEGMATSSEETSAKTGDRVEAFESSSRSIARQSLAVIEPGRRPGSAGRRLRASGGVERVADKYLAINCRAFL